MFWRIHHIFSSMSFPANETSVGRGMSIATFDYWRVIMIDLPVDFEGIRYIHVYPILKTRYDKTTSRITIVS